MYSPAIGINIVTPGYCGRVDARAFEQPIDSALGNTAAKDSSEMSEIRQALMTKAGYLYAYSHTACQMTQRFPYLPLTIGGQS